ncbi:MAG TPA: hypothetical protein VOA64_19375, partial [Candidatus Dormibacteraeota bacterium]|nr:hypothetical protein [Candidatus Dormibacteraeota bacterium]
EKSDLLKIRVIIYAYNHHARLLPSEPSVVKQPKSTRIEGADIVMKSSVEGTIPLVRVARLSGTGGLVIPRNRPFPNCQNRSELSYQSAPRHRNIQAVPLFELGALT